MGRTSKKKRQRCQKFVEIKNPDPPDAKVLDSIGSPNVWTPKKEEEWLNEIMKMHPNEVSRRYPSMKKPPNVSRRGKNS